MRREDEAFDNVLFMLDAERIRYQSLAKKVQKVRNNSAATTLEVISRTVDSVGTWNGIAMMSAGIVTMVDRMKAEVDEMRKELEKERSKFFCDKKKCTELHNDIESTLGEMLAYSKAMHVFATLVNNIA